MRRELRMLGVAAMLSCFVQPSFGGEVAESIAKKMGVVTDDLNKTITGKPVQTEQKTIVNELDTLIASLEQECENCKKGGMKRLNAKNGMTDSTISQGPGGIGTLVNPAETGKDWGKLSARERDRIIQSMSEGFPAEYRTVLERYYRRLADEKGSTAKADASKSTEAAAQKTSAK